MHTDAMKRKVAKVAPLRLSPNEEALILKRERERRRKLRLQQVREQEKFIAQQIRQDVRERRDQQMQRLAEDLKVKWETEQAEKLKTLEKVYLSTLSSIGEGHRQAKENEPDLKAIEMTAALNKEKAEKRHREALKELQQHREKLLREQTWKIGARRKALIIEKERAAKIASLPPPPPDPIETLDIVKRPQLVKLCNVDTFSESHYHLPEAYVDREMDTEQPDARVAAAVEEKRLDALQKEEERERHEQMEKAILRGSHALKMVHLSQDRERLLKELEHMQQEDLARRRQIVSEMPQQLFEPPYRRAEIMEEWQRELESAFEDIYTKDSKMKGDLVLHLKPQPLPDPSVASVDEELDLSVEPEAVSEIEPRPERRMDPTEPQEGEGPQSKQVLRRLLNRIRTQKDQWSARSDAQSAADTLESGSLPLENIGPHFVQEGRSDTPEPKEVTDNTVLAGNSILLHPQEQAARITLETERKKKMEDLEQQKREQLELLKRLEEEKQLLEEEYGRVQQQMQEASTRQMEQEYVATMQEDNYTPEDPESLEPSMSVSAENLHIQLIREYQHRLVEQNRLHKLSVDEARRRLSEYQLLLKKRYPHLSTSCQETAENNLEIVGGGQSPKPEALISLDASSSLSGRIMPVNDPYSTPVMVKGELHIKQTSRTLERKETSPRSTLPDFKLMGAEIHDDSILQGHEVSNRLHLSVKSLEASVIDGPSQEPLPYSGPPYESLEPQEPLPCSGPPEQSPHEDKSRLPHIDEKQSYTSSPGEYETSSSTSYNPLPSELSLGLPHGDVPEPAVPLSLPSLGAIHKEHLSFGDFSNVREFRERLLSSTADIQAQQEQLRNVQDHLDKQRDFQLSKQKSQEEQLLQRQRQLEEQIKLHQEALENVIASAQPGISRQLPDVGQIRRKDQYHFMSTLLEELEESSQEVLQQEATNEFSSSVLIRPHGREHRWRPSKPPVTKTKLGPFLEQHELSAIIEVETPTSGRRSSTGLAESFANIPGASGILMTNEAAFGRNRTDTSILDRTCNESSNQSLSKLSWREMLSVGDSLVPIATGLPRKIHTDIDHRELDLSRLSTSSMDSNTEQSQQKLSWREMLSLNTSQHAGHTDLLFTSMASNSPAIDRGASLDHTSVPQGAPQYGESTQQSPDGDNLSTTLSTGSFLTSEKTDSSPANSDAVSELHRCNFSIIGEAQEGTSSPTAAKAVISPESGRWQTLLNPLENLGHIQQIIEKYTKDLGTSLGQNSSFRSPAAALDTSVATTFYSLEPKPDLSVSMSSCAFSNQTSNSLNGRDINQASQSTISQEQQQPLPDLHRDTDVTPSIGLAIAHNLNLAGNLPTVLNGPAAEDHHSTTSFYSLEAKPDFSASTPSSAFSNQTSNSLYTNVICQDSRNTNCQQSYRPSAWSPPHSNADLRLSLSVSMPDLARSSCRSMGESADSTGSFLPLHPCSTLNDTNVSSQQEASYRVLAAPRIEPVAEESGSFHELMATRTTVNESEFSAHPIPHHEEQNNSRSVHFEELPVVNKDDHNQEYLGTSDHFPSDQTETETLVPPGRGSYCSTATEMDASNQTLVPGTLGSRSVSSLNFTSSVMTSFSSGSLPSCVYTWGSGSARGIMEEPDLTLLSLNDSSIVSSDPPVACSSVSEIQEDGHSSQSSFKPLPAEVDDSGVGQPDRSSLSSSLSQYFADIDLKLTSTPGSLQEAFLNKKKAFIEKSSKRIQDIKTKERFPTVDQISQQKDKPVTQVDQSLGSDPAQADEGRLKKVAEVRVSSAEDRKLSEIEMHQRTVRLYNQLDEVKSRKEEKMRQEAYARNREKAKEFKKRTLDKLRGNKRK